MYPPTHYPRGTRARNPVVSRMLATWEFQNPPPGTTRITREGGVIFCSRGRARQRPRPCPVFRRMEQVIQAAPEHLFTVLLVWLAHESLVILALTTTLKKTGCKTKPRSITEVLGRPPLKGRPSMIHLTTWTARISSNSKSRGCCVK